MGRPMAHRNLAGDMRLPRWATMQVLQSCTVPDRSLPLWVESSLGIVKLD